MGTIARHCLETVVFYIGSYKHRKQKQTEWSGITLESSAQQSKLNRARGQPAEWEKMPANESPDRVIQL